MQNIDSIKSMLFMLLHIHTNAKQNTNNNIVYNLPGKILIGK